MNRIPAISKQLSRQIAARRALFSQSSGTVHNRRATIRPLLLATQKRNFYGGKTFLKLFVRAPLAAAGSAIIAGAAYVNYKVKEIGSYTSDTLEKMVDFASGMVDGAKDGMGGIESTFKEWLDAVRENSKSPSSSSSGGGNSNSGSNNGSNGGSGDSDPAAALLGAAVALNTGNDDPANSNSYNANEMMTLTRKMIEIRHLLHEVGQSKNLQLPSIVVIGSQSSGKSSVLEALVGHEFLPKGTNMVTRRPIELTLINSNEENGQEYGVFPALQTGKITDFGQVQRTLTDLNLAVPASEAVSDDPIQLHIYSPKVPDLTLIDLPGYIQVSGSDQPEFLKQRINEVCEKYIQAPNVILAISSADVDMANSSALRASRRVDPRGERTIGVVTKMDLVDSAKGHDILTNQNYPLQMGYVGVITKTPQSSSGLFRRGVKNNIGSLISHTENAYFSQHQDFDDCTVGKTSLKQKLMKVLEQTMAASLLPAREAIRRELEEATYQFKVEYNDRYLTPESYLAGSVDSFKLAFKDFTNQFGKNEIKSLLKAELDQKVLNILAQGYWNRPSDVVNPSNISERKISELMSMSDDDAYWRHKLDSCTSKLTKLGVGRLSTNLVISALGNEMERLIDNTNFRNHPFATNTINEAVAGILGLNFYSASDQVENCIKPYKYEVEIEDREWTKSREHSYQLLKEELRQCEGLFNQIKHTVGGHKLNQVVKYIESKRDGISLNNDSSDMDSFGFSQGLIDRGREALFLRGRADILKLRLAAIKSRTCKSSSNKYKCPEVFLDVVADKLAQTAVLFLHVELISDFYYNFPRELDSRLGSLLTKEQIESFAREDPKVSDHVDLQRRKELLELALNKVEDVIELEKHASFRNGASRPSLITRS
ncbi:similar to Saccharomyces cerevisiae YOR211C MGM1 Mitochondrial GTPase [Geotrichum candidum]|uniref:dynamin GTPase n=1 Tax=Geotrichum candidum TaxID=1173061 RepID=A0A0J9YHP7_GEOCN|nr:similar to Saccharomyces cerevisiae YOR211C MGM1 Mitochondrial GTPase [Geotrichum candidum]